MRRVMPRIDWEEYRVERASVSPLLAAWAERCGLVATPEWPERDGYHVLYIARDLVSRCVKVGITTKAGCPDFRLTQLSRAPKPDREGCLVVPVAFVPDCHSKHEHALQRALAPWRTRVACGSGGGQTEWFRPASEVEVLVDLLTAARAAKAA